jgi:hypothetical protein
LTHLQLWLRGLHFGHFEAVLIAVSAGITTAAHFNLRFTQLRTKICQYTACFCFNKFDRHSPHQVSYNSPHALFPDVQHLINSIGAYKR